MLRNNARVLGALGALLLIASSVSAQLPVKLSLSGVGLSTNLNTEEATGKQRLSGFSAGGGATVAYRRLGLDIRYLEGSLTPNGGGTGRDIVEGELMFSVRALSWLSLRIGPHIRSFVMDNGTERWLFWEGRVRTETRLGTRRVTSSLELWYVLSGNVNTVEQYDGGQGLEGTLRWQISSNLPLWLNLGYRIDRSNLGGGSRTEVLEHIILGIGFGRGVAN